jgi:beta-barrel assembly-enhancing protease
MAKSEIYLADQKFDKANQQIDKVLNISPGNYPASIIKSNVLSAQQKTIQAEEILRELLISKNNDPHLWMLLSEIQRAGKNIVGYHLSQGEYYLLLGDLENALNQFQLALGLSANSFQTSELIMTKIKFAQDRLGQKRGL